MRIASFIIILVIGALRQGALAQGTVITDNRLPVSSIELKRNDPPATSTPWLLPKPGDLLYDAKKEAAIKNDRQAPLVHVFERGVFKGYAALTSGPPSKKPAKKMQDTFTRNPRLPSDAVELSLDEQPDKSDYFPTRPKTRPPNVPPDYMPVRVFYRGKVFGWSYLPKDGVAELHKSK